MTDGTPRAPRAGFRLRVIAACLNARSRYNYSIFDRVLLKENYKGPVYMEKPGALTICMENPEIPGRIHDKWNGSTPVKIFPKNSNTFRGITFFSFLPKRPKFLYHLFRLLLPGSMSRESEKFTGILWMIQFNHVPVFGAKKMTVPFDGNFLPKFPYK